MFQRVLDVSDGETDDEEDFRLFPAAENMGHFLIEDPDQDDVENREFDEEQLLLARGAEDEIVDVLLSEEDEDEDDIDEDLLLFGDPNQVGSSDDDCQIIK